MDFPRKINLGSGKDFREDYLNIDISGQWRPDIVADVSRAFPKNGAEQFSTRRFGDITLTEGMFDEIICNDVLEHVADLVATMTNCLGLLKTGGQFRINVPYDLSHGAWQDPTHVRAFNEKSWLYYTEWFWYLGWQTHRFHNEALEFVPSPLGLQMVQQKIPYDVILRTPRAVEAMKITLKKIELSEKDRAELARFSPPQPVEA